jgi:hypothetical protein
MKWRVVKEADLSAPGFVLYDEGWTEPWSFFKDRAAFSSDPGSNLYKGHEQIKFYDRRGYKWNAAQTLYGDLPDDKKLRIYFAADFNQAQRGYVYKTNSIVIEFYTE